MMSLFRISLLCISLIVPVLAEASVGLADIKSVVNQVEFVSKKLNKKFHGKQEIILESEALESRRMKVAQITGADEVLNHIRVNQDTISLTFKF